MSLITCPFTRSSNWATRRGFITEFSTCRWAFYATSIADGAIQILGLFFLKETYVAKILGTKAKELRKETGNTVLRNEFEFAGRNLTNTLKRSLSRPFRLIGTQIIIQLPALYMMFLYGLMYLVLSTFPTPWTKTYHESIGIGGLNYIALALGFTVGMQTCAYLLDKSYLRLNKKNGGIAKSEFRVLLLISGSVLVPIGLFLYGWSAEFETSWIVPDIGAAIFSAGIIMSIQCCLTYIMDCYTLYAASAIAATVTLRNLAGFAFPLNAPQLYSALGSGWGNSLLAFVAIGLGWPAPSLLGFYVGRLRARSPSAAGG